MKAKILTGLLGRALVALPIAGFFSSCELVREDLAECPVPVLELRFVYDYNMEFANAFHKQFDCLSVYFFDAEGRLAKTEKITDREILADEEFRMHPELPEGSYRVVAYGGMECDRASFSNNNPAEGSLLGDMYVHLNPGCLTDDSRRLLHNHYYGSTEFTLDTRNDTYATVEMMRNTNTVQVALQHTNGSDIDCDDFIFEIRDDNNDFDCENNLLVTGEIIYKPYNTENHSTGLLPDKDDTRAGEINEVHSALAQFTTSRLVLRTAANGKQTTTSLVVRRASDDKTIISIPLLNYMLMFKSDNSGAGLGEMGDQEYLDRENRWNFVFFLDENNLWINTRFIVNDWEVRINSTDF